MLKKSPDYVVCISVGVEHPDDPVAVIFCIVLFVS